MLLFFKFLLLIHIDMLLLFWVFSLSFSPFSYSPFPWTICITDSHYTFATNFNITETNVSCSVTT